MGYDNVLVKATDARNSGKTIGLVQGSWDLFHLGHLRYILKARELCDYLIIAMDSDDKIKTLRLKEGKDYSIKIKGTGRGKMDYTIGYMDDSGEYSDMRNFRNIDITRSTVIDTSTKYSDKTILNVDEDGDGKYDLKFRAGANEYGELVDYTYIVYIVSGIVGAVAILAVILVIRKKSKNRKAAQ